MANIVYIYIVYSVLFDFKRFSKSQLWIFRWCSQTFKWLSKDPRRHQDRLPQRCHHVFNFFAISRKTERQTLQTVWPRLWFLWKRQMGISQSGEKAMSDKWSNSEYWLESFRKEDGYPHRQRHHHRHHHSHHHQQCFLKLNGVKTCPKVISVRRFTERDWPNQTRRKSG